MEKKGFVYILTNQRNGTLYIGVTSNLSQRILQHRQKTYDGFTAKYNLSLLVRFQEFPTIQEAIMWEKKIKGWKREKKLQLIEEVNIGWKDLAENI